MAASETLKQLVAQMPDADGRGMLTENIDKGKIEKAIAAIHAGGRENVVGLIELLGEPGSAADVKPHYALHCLANHTLVVKDEGGRKQLCEVLGGELGGDRPKHVQAFLCQELGWAGGRESLAPLGRVLTDEALSAPAAMALAAIGDGAAAEFRAAWPKAKGKARLDIIDGLAANPDPPSADLFKEALGDGDAEIRVAAAAGLAKLGDPSAAEPMLKLASANHGWDRFQAAKSCLVLAEKLAAAGNKAEAQRLYEALKTRVPAPHIHDAAQRGLAAVAG